MHAVPGDRIRTAALASVFVACLSGMRDALEGPPEREVVAMVTTAPVPSASGPELVLDPERPDCSIAYLPRPHDPGARAR